MRSIRWRTHSARFAEIWIVSLAPTLLVGYQFAPRRRTASQVLGARGVPLRRAPAAGPSLRGPTAPSQGRWATVLDRMDTGHLNRQVLEAQSLSARGMEVRGSAPSVPQAFR